MMSKKMVSVGTIAALTVIGGAARLVTEITASSKKRDETVSKLAVEAVGTLAFSMNCNKSILENLVEILKIRRLDPDRLVETNILNAYNHWGCIDGYKAVKSCANMLKELVIACSSTAVDGANIFDVCNGIINKHIK